MAWLRGNVRKSGFPWLRKSVIYGNPWFGGIRSGTCVITGIRNCANPWLRKSVILRVSVIRRKFPWLTGFRDFDGIPGIDGNFCNRREFLWMTGFRDFGGMSGGTFIIMGIHDYGSSSMWWNIHANDGSDVWGWGCVVSPDRFYWIYSVHEDG
jgi:hypothetical protein